MGIYYCIEHNCESEVKGKNRRCQSCAQIKRFRNPKNHPFYGKKRPDISKKMMGINNSMFGRKRPKISVLFKLLWQNKNYRNKIIEAQCKGIKIKLNKSEERLNKLLQQLLPKEYKFVGDGKIVIVGFIPDFININGQKKIIELYGDYWHNLPSYKERDVRRLIAYKRYGYKTLIIWEHELKDLNKLKQKILNF